MRSLTWILSASMLIPLAAVAQEGGSASVSVRPTLFVGSEDLSHGQVDAALHLGVTARTAPITQGVTLELELSLDADENFALSDNSSFVKVSWQPGGWSPDEGLSLAILPFHSDRLYLGYAFPLTDKVGPYSGGPVLGTELRVTRARWYAFAALKSQSQVNDFDLESERNFTGFVGAGVDVLPWLSLEAEGSRADLGTNPNYVTLRSQQTVSATGWAARVSAHRGLPISPPPTYDRYRADPARWERLTEAQAYDEGLSTALSIEALGVTQSGLAGDTLVLGGESQTGIGVAAEGRVRWKALRGFVRAQSRSPELVESYSIGLPPFRALPQGTVTADERMLSLAADYHFARTGLTPGLAMELVRPATFTPPGTTFGGTSSASRTAVAYPDGNITVLPAGEKVGMIWRVTGTLRWEGGPLAVLANAFVEHDPNGVSFVDSSSGAAMAVREDQTAGGFNLLLQARF
jgi:hypothetical protein